MTLLSRCLVFATALLAISATAHARQTGTTRVTGRVLDSVRAQPVPGVAVTVDGNKAPVFTDLDGRYVLHLTPGKHEITLRLSGFADRVIAVDVVSTSMPDVNVTLSLATFTEEITVSAQAYDAVTSSAAAQLLERRRASTISDNLGSMEMKANADSTAAGALQRVTGLSLVDNQFVFVRGLGERYSNTTLNGAMVPSTAPDRKVVSLDMFPTGLLDGVSVVKTYTPDRSAEFAGGLVEIMPSRVTVRPMLNASYTFGGNSQVWGADVLDHSGGDGDWLGLANDSRRMPAGFPDRRLIRGGIFTPELGFSRDELERWGESLTNDWSPRFTSGRPHQSFSVAAGQRWNRLGVSGSVSQNYSTEFRQEDQVYYNISEGELSPFSTYDYRVGSSTGSLAALINAGYQMNASHRLSFQGFSTNKGRRETRTFEGFNDDAGRNLRNSRLLWQEESLRTAQVAGDHLFSTLSNSRLEWRGTVSRSSLDEPDIRETLYQEIDDVYVLADESQSGLRQFNNLDEKTWDAGASWSTTFAGIHALPAMVKFGAQVTNRQRDFASRRFRFIPIDVVRFDLSPSPEELFTPANIGPRFELREETRSTDFYDAEQRTISGYGMLDASFSARARLIAGARVERFRQHVDTFDLFDTDVDDEIEIIRGEILETDFFPSVGFVYALRPDHNLRLGFSQTVNRPEFREVAPFEFTDIVGGRAVVGNPDLQRSLIRNYDVRWEWFPRAVEVISASLFLKQFDQPIERIVEPTAQLRTSFANAKSARNFGFELEARKDLSGTFTLGGNYAFVDSSIELDSSQTGVLTSLERPLSGTSRHVFNGLVEVRTPIVTGRLLVNAFADRISDVGSLGIPDILEQGRSTVDLVLMRRVGHLDFRFAAENLGNAEVRYLQGSETHRLFTIGRVFTFQIGVIGF